MASLVDQIESATPLQSLLDERVLNLPDRLLDLLPVGVYVCDQDGLIVRYNRAAAELWGCSPKIGDPTVRYCGSYRLYGMDGGYVPHAKCPMADVIATGQGLRDGEIMIERPDGTRIVALVNIEAIKDAIYTTDAAGRITFYNDAAAELWGIRPELGTSAFCGSWKLYWPDGTSMPHDECPMALSLKERRPIRGMEAVAERPDGARIPFIPYPTPLFDASGTLIGAVNMLVDITERRQAEQRIRDSEARYRDIAAIVESSEDAVVAKNLDSIITSWNRGAERLFGYTAKETIGNGITMLVPPERRDEESNIIARIRRGERVEPYETIRQRKDGSIVEISLTISPVRNPEGKIIGASTIAHNISERRQAEERQRLLLREMDHRVKNLFALSSGMVALSARSAKTPQELSLAVQDRLAALAKAHALTLPRPSEDGHRTERPTTLHVLIETILSPYGSRTDDDRPRIVIRGPDIPIANGAITSFALLLHEFATNAAKYGALSTSVGTIDIVCAEDNGQFALSWTERGGPLVENQIDGDGFGTLLARATVEGQLGGEITRDWKPEGLTIRLSVARDRVIAE